MTTILIWILFWLILGSASATGIFLKGEKVLRDRYTLAVTARTPINNFTDLEEGGRCCFIATVFFWPISLALYTGWYCGLWAQRKIIAFFEKERIPTNEPPVE